MYLWTIYGSAWFEYYDQSEISPILLNKNIPLPWLFPIYVILDFYRLHYPHSFVGPFELFKKDRVLCWKIISERSEVVCRSFLRLTILLELLFISLNILGKQVFSANLIPISKMIDPLVGKQSHFIQSVS